MGRHHPSASMGAKRGADEVSLTAPGVILPADGSIADEASLALREAAPPGVMSYLAGRTSAQLQIAVTTRTRTTPNRGDYDGEDGADPFLRSHLLSRAKCHAMKAGGKYRDMSPRHRKRDGIRLGVWIFRDARMNEIFTIWWLFDKPDRLSLGVGTCLRQLAVLSEIYMQLKYVHDARS